MSVILLAHEKAPLELRGQRPSPPATIRGMEPNPYEAPQDVTEQSQESTRDRNNLIDWIVIGVVVLLCTVLIVLERIVAMIQ
jgi:hypothetical protein